MTEKAKRERLRAERLKAEGKKNELFAVFGGGWAEHRPAVAVKALVSDKMLSDNGPKGLYRRHVIIQAESGWNTCNPVWF